MGLDFHILFASSSSIKKGGVDEILYVHLSHFMLRYFRKKQIY